VPSARAALDRGFHAVGKTLGDGKGKLAALVRLLCERTGRVEGLSAMHPPRLGKADADDLGGLACQLETTTITSGHFSYSWAGTSFCTIEFAAVDKEPLHDGQ